MDLARGLITSLVDEDKLNEVNRSGIDASFLQDQDCETVFAYIQRHYTEYKKVPSRDAVKQVRIRDIMAYAPRFTFALII